MRRLSRMFRFPPLFGVILGRAPAAVLFALIAVVFALPGIDEIPFGGDIKHNSYLASFWQAAPC